MSFTASCHQHATTPGRIQCHHAPMSKTKKKRTQKQKSKRPNKQTSKDTNKQTTKYTNKHTNKQTSDQANDQANRQGSNKAASTSLPGVVEEVESAIHPLPVLQVEEGVGDALAVASLEDVLRREDQRLHLQQVLWCGVVCQQQHRHQRHYQQHQQQQHQQQQHHHLGSMGVELNSSMNGLNRTQLHHTQTPF